MHVGGIGQGTALYLQGLSVSHFQLGGKALGPAAFSLCTCSNKNIYDLACTGILTFTAK